MLEKRDIETRADIMKLVDSFYAKVLENKVLGFIFTDIAEINLTDHMPKMYDFWESTIFHKAVYKGNPMAVHMNLNKKIPLTRDHFKTWLELFNDTVTELFDGKNAALAKTRALSIATVIQIKIK